MSAHGSLAARHHGRAVARWTPAASKERVGAAGEDADGGVTGAHGP